MFQAEMARRNDEFRKKALKKALTGIQYEVHGTVLATQGIDCLPIETQFYILKAIFDFDNFTEDNDPWNEHDFGKITGNHPDVFWKIDYYPDETGEFDLDSEWGTEDDLLNSYRVLMIMLASEY